MSQGIQVIVNIYKTHERYATILADPPWPYQDTAPRLGKQRTERIAYQLMTIDEICGLPVRRLADKDCILWLWTTNPFLEEAFKVLRSWGFRYRTACPWVKDRTTTGHWFLGQSEHLLLATRGRPKRRGRRYPGLITSFGRLRHSSKPRMSYEIIESMSYEPRIELFARRARPGWDSWGNEAKDIDRELERDVERYL